MEAEATATAKVCIIFFAVAVASASMSSYLAQILQTWDSPGLMLKKSCVFPMPAVPFFPFNREE